MLTALWGQAAGLQLQQATLAALRRPQTYIPCSWLRHDKHIVLAILRDAEATRLCLLADSSPAGRFLSPW